MNEATANAVPTAPSPEPPPPTSIWARMFNVLAAPGEVFDEVKASPARTANWLVPALFIVVVGWVSTWLIFSQPVINQQLADMQEKQLQKMVEQGKMKAEQVETARAGMETVGRIMKIAGGIAGPVIGAFASPFWGALLIWLVGAKVLKGSFDYMKAVEVAGLSNVVSVLGAVVKTLLILLMGNIFAGASPALFIKDFDQTNTLHGALAALDLFALWVCGVRAVGMSRLGGASLGVCLAWMIGLWAAFTAFLLGLGAAAKMAFGG